MRSERGGIWIVEVGGVWVTGDAYGEIDRRRIVPSSLVVLKLKLEADCSLESGPYVASERGQ